MTGNNTWWDAGSSFMHNLIGLPENIARLCTTPQHYDGRTSPPASAGLGGKCGIGMLLVDCENPTYNNYNVAVQACLPGGAADASKQIQPGDVLLRIDGRDVVGMRMQELGDLLLGPVESSVTLSMKRGAGWKGGEGRVYTVDLKRRWAAAGLKDLPE